jgi:U3 small nucleolar RNA-associated protein 6
MSLERLRQKRCKRLNIKGSLAHAGQARILLIFDRGTRKHIGDLSLWMSYLEYARSVKATRRFQTVLTTVLRLHPTNAELWLFAAKWALEAEADMNSARSYMQRGTRFCNGSKELWIEYAKLEMIYLAKIGMRRRILGLEGKTATEDAPRSEKAGEKDKEDPGFAISQDMIAIPDFKAQTIQPSMMDTVNVDAEAVKDITKTPALNGAIPLAIFDAAKQLPFYTALAAEEFFNMFATFTQAACQPLILQHVVDSMMEAFPTDSSAYSCFIRQPIIGINPMTPDFPVALASSLERLKASREKTNDKDQLSEKVAAWIKPLLALEGLDSDIQKVLSYTLRKLQ